MLKTLKVVSITEINHNEGDNLPADDQQLFRKHDLKLRSIFDHFNELQDVERNFLDLREYRKQIIPAPNLSVEFKRAQSEAPKKINQSSFAGSGKSKSYFDRAMPILVRENVSSIRYHRDKLKYTEKEADEMLK